MIIQSIELNNFRNYENLHISFDEGTNILFGDNAQGKTNILEAAYLSGTTKSHKGSKDKEMIRFGTNEAHLRTMVLKNGKQYQIDMHLKHNRSKGIAVNKIPMKKASELFGILNIVFFSPEDLNIIKNGPGERRRFLDMELCQLDKLADTGKKIIRRREQFVKELNELVHEIHYRISGGREELFLSYEPSVSADLLEQELERVKLRDLKQCQTSVGPHRDDLLFSIAGVDIRKLSMMI